MNIRKQQHLYVCQVCTFKYRNYYDAYWTPILEPIGLSKFTPHCTRHTCISLLAQAKVDQTSIKLIVGHRGAMSLTEKVYTHLDINTLIDAVNKAYVPDFIKQQINTKKS